MQYILVSLGEVRISGPRKFAWSTTRSLRNTSHGDSDGLLTRPLLAMMSTVKYLYIKGVASHWNGNKPFHAALLP